MKIGIVRATFNKEYTDQMLDAAKEQVEERDLELTAVIEVPGVHEVPVAVENLLCRNDIDGVAALGVIIKGGTDHDKVLAYNVSKQLLELSCEHGKAVGLGIMGPNLGWAQAEKRVESYAKKAVDAAIDTYNALESV